MLKNLPDYIVPDDALHNMSYWLKWVDKLLGEIIRLKAKIDSLENHINKANKEHHDAMKFEYECSSKWECQCDECIDD